MTAPESPVTRGQQDPGRGGATLHVCTTCRGGQGLPPDGIPMGLRLLEAAVLAAGDFRVVPTSCLASCDKGCAAVLSQPGKWSYLLGRVRPEMAADLVAYAREYAASSSGGVMPPDRPPSMASHTFVLGRVPGAA